MTGSVSVGSGAAGQILHALGRIEGELVEIRKLGERVSRLEHWQARLKGAWAVLAAGFGYLVKVVAEH